MLAVLIVLDHRHWYIRLFPHGEIILFCMSDVWKCGHVPQSSLPDLQDTFWPQQSAQVTPDLGRSSSGVHKSCRTEGVSLSIHCFLSSPLLSSPVSEGRPRLVTSAGVETSQGVKVHLQALVIPCHTNR